MATIRKQGIDPHAVARQHLGEEKCFGRASLLKTTPRKPGLNPHNANSGCDEPILEADAVPAKPIVPAFNHTRH